MEQTTKKEEIRKILNIKNKYEGTGINILCCVSVYVVDSSHVCHTQRP